MRKASQQYLRVSSPNLLYLNAKAALAIKDRLDVYECGRVTALVSAPLGVFHTGRKSDKCAGKNISSEDLVEFLCQKYGVAVGSSLSVWTFPEEDGGILYVGLDISAEESRYRMDGRFTKVELAYRCRYGDRVYIEDNCLSFTAKVRERLPRRLSLFGYGKCLALVGDPEGPYIVEYRNGRKGGAVYSSQLAQFCKSRFGASGRSILLYATELKDGVCFSDSEDALPPREPFVPKHIDLGWPKERFISLHRNWRIYFSAQVARALTPAFSVYTAGKHLAFRCESWGRWHIQRWQYQSVLHSKSLCEEIARRYPNANRLYLRPHGDMLALVPIMGEDGLPTPERFRRLSVEGEFSPEPGRRRRPGDWYDPRPEGDSLEL